MAQEIIQLTLALMPAMAVGFAINRINMPWDKQKRPAERSELLRLLARDIKRVKAVMARQLAAANVGSSCSLPRLPLANWQKVKRDARLQKYANEPIFKTIIAQLREWENV